MVNKNMKTFSNIFSNYTQIVVVFHLSTDETEIRI